MSCRMFSRKGRIRPGTQWYFFRIQDSDRLFRIQIRACHKRHGSYILERIHNSAWVNNILKGDNFLQVRQSLPIIDFYYTNTLYRGRENAGVPVLFPKFYCCFGVPFYPVLFPLLILYISFVRLWYGFFFSSLFLSLSHSLSPSLPMSLLLSLSLSLSLLFF